MSAEPTFKKPGVSALVGLSLLEVIRMRDLPTEILDSENPSQTLPRRLGLSEAVGQQIRRLRAETRRRGGISEEEVKALFGLVLRRPDAEAVFFQAGELLGGKDAEKGGRRRWYPERIGYALARRQVGRRFRSLFGRPMGEFGHGPFTLEASKHFLLEMDGEGQACALLSGFAQSILSRCLSRPVEVTHSTCLGTRHDLCRWTTADGRAL